MPDYKEKYEKYKRLYNDLYKKVNEKMGGNIDNINNNNLYIHNKLLGGKSDIEKKILAILSDDNSTTNNLIEILNNNNIDKFINNNKLCIILFHTPECHYCINFKPIYKKFAKYVIDNNINCKIASYDCNSNKLNNDSNYSQYINGYQTILKFHNNKIELFDDDRNIENLIKFSKNNKSNSEFDSTIIKLTDKTFDSFINSPAITKSILFHRLDCPYCKAFLPLYNKLVKNNHNTNKYIFGEFDCELFDTNKIDSKYTSLIEGVPTLIKIKNNKISRLNYFRTLSNLKKFFHII